MRFTLEDYQQTAVDRALSAIARARRDFDDDSSERTAVGLTAPTGAGKTVIATAVLEGIFFGPGAQPARPAAALRRLPGRRPHCARSPRAT